MNLIKISLLNKNDIDNIFQIADKLRKGNSQKYFIEKTFILLLGRKGISVTPGLMRLNFLI